CSGHSVLGCLPQPEQETGVVRRHVDAVAVDDGEVELGTCMPLPGCLGQPGNALGTRASVGGTATLQEMNRQLVLCRGVTRFGRLPGHDEPLRIVARSKKREAIDAFRLTEGCRTPVPD